MRISFENFEVMKEEDIQSGKFCQSLVAFANSGGGNIRFERKSAEETASMRERILREAEKSIMPSIRELLRCSERDSTEGKVLLIEVKQGNKRPYCLTEYGFSPQGIFIRKRGKNALASFEDLSRFYYQKEPLFEERTSENQALTFSAVSKRMAEEGGEWNREHMLWFDVLNTEGEYTNLGLLLSDQCPYTIQLTIAAGGQLRQMEIGGSVLEQWNRVLDSLGENAEHGEWTREAILNAIQHRDYEKQDPIRIIAEEDQLTVISPGGLPRKMSWESLREGVCAPRNKRLCAVFREAELTANIGSGIYLMMRHGKDSGFVPLFEAKEDSFTVVLPNPYTAKHSVRWLRRRERPERLPSLYKLNQQVKGNKSLRRQAVQKRKESLRLPLTGLQGESIWLTAVPWLNRQAVLLRELYEMVSDVQGVTDTILLDAHASATIEGARTTVARVRNSINDPRTKDDKMVVNSVQGCHFAYGQPITQGNIRTLWDIVVEDVCENENAAGERYRSDMVVIGSDTETIHTPAQVEQIEPMMDSLFDFLEKSDLDILLRSFVFHFYFVYIHPFCDGNGRMARILNSSQLYHAGFSKMPSLPLSRFINQKLSGYYQGLKESERVYTVKKTGEKWLDITPFVSYMLEVFADCLISAPLVESQPTPREEVLLFKMNKRGLGAEINRDNAARIMRCSEEEAQSSLNDLCRKGYLELKQYQKTTVYVLRHLMEER